VNLELRTLTASKQETLRLQNARERGVFSSAAYPVPKGFLQNGYADVLNALPQHEKRFATFLEPADNDVGYQFNNGFFSSPDTEVLYTMVRRFRPKHILEIGCGNSTRIIRQAIIDGAFSSVLTCVDPCPRQDVSRLADNIITRSVETLNPIELAMNLGPDGLLFIDTSHELKPANDVAFIYGCLLPVVPVGTLLQIHDIFLPFEYVEDKAITRRLVWGEQYVVAALLAHEEDWEVLWPGHYLQRTNPNFACHFPFLRGEQAGSLWLRKLLTKESGSLEL
jgi:hypothetical protein